MGPRQKNRASECSRRLPYKTTTPPHRRPLRLGEKRKQTAAGCGSFIIQHTHSTAVPQHDIVYITFVIMLRHGYSREFMLNDRQI